MSRPIHAGRRLAGVIVAALTMIAMSSPAFSQGTGGGRGGGTEGTGGRYDNNFGRDENRWGLRVEVSGCLRSSTAVVVHGPVGDPSSKGISLVIGGQPYALSPSSWNDAWMQLSIPAGVPIPADGEVEVHYTDAGRPVGRIATVATCAGGGGTRIATADPGTVTGTATPRVTDGPTATAPDGTPEFIVAVATGQAGAASAALQAQGATLLRTRTLANLGESLLIFSLGGLTPGAAQGALDAAGTGGVIAPHHLYGYAAGPRLFAPAMVGAPQGSCTLAGPVKIGVIDGPVDPRNAALAGLNMQVRSFYDDGGLPAVADHGTAVTGLIGGAPTAGPLAGFAPGAQIYAAAVFSQEGGAPSATVERVAAALDWLIGENVRLTNLSFAGPWNRALEREIALATERGAILVAAAGNDGTEDAMLPAGAPGVIAVTAVDAARRLYSRANKGSHIAFAAPGVDVWAAKSGGGGYFSGTSFAAPIVTAFAGRLLARDPSLGADEIRTRLRDRAVDLGTPGHDAQFGWGLAMAPDC